MPSKVPVFNNPLVDKNGKAAEHFRNWILAASLEIPIYGSGSPEGVVEADQFQKYVDTAGAAGSIEYRKMLSDIGGDRSMGWKLT